MAKRSTGLRKKNKSKRSPKTKKRLEIKRLMLEKKNSKKRSLRYMVSFRARPWGIWDPIRPGPTEGVVRRGWLRL